MQTGVGKPTMKTSATNRKVRVLLSAIKNGSLIPKPEFQRRLVWTNKDKRAFLKTVLQGYPFPEVYIAAGKVDLDTGEGSEMLVDGQQRLTTLYQYFTGDKDLILGNEFLPYTKLSNDEKNDFLEYEVVIRDLGSMSIDEIKEVFQRINSTTYSLNAMEINNARFNGEFKTFADELTQHSFFENKKIFSAAEIRRMLDVQFVLIFIVTIMSNYFNRNDELEDYLKNYNDEFDIKEDLKADIEKVFMFIDSCQFKASSRVWKKADLLALLVEVYRLLIRDKKGLDSKIISQTLTDFYDQVDAADDTDEESLTRMSLPIKNLFHKLQTIEEQE
jgi:hypothetical protein